MEKPRWLSFVLRAVGLNGSGDNGVLKGDLRGAKGVTGDLSDNTGLVACVVIGATLRESFGFIALEASMLTDLVLIVL